MYAACVGGLSLPLRLVSRWSTRIGFLNTVGALPWLALASSLLVSFGIWHWAENILIPTNTKQALAKGVPIGNNSDLYPRWLGAREALLHHRDPYGADVTREIQTGFFGRPLDPSKPSDPPFQESFVYPLYVVFLLTPTLTMRFSTAQEIFRWLLLFVTGCSALLWMYAVGFRLRPLLKITGIVLVLSSYPAVIEFHMENLAALALFLLAAGAAAAVRNWLVLSGFLLAFATVKPDISGLVVLWFLLWSMAQWKDRKRLIYSFAGTMAVLVIAAEAVSPHWIPRFLRAVREYPTYGGDPSLVQLFLPSFAGKLATAALVCVLVAVCWRWRKAVPGSEDFAWALAWVSTVTIAILPKLAGYNLPLLIPALLVLLAQRETIWKAGSVPRLLAKAVLACQLWQWTTAIILSFCSLLVPATRLSPAALVPEYTLFSLSAFTLLTVIAVTYSRWRASHPNQAPGVIPREMHPDRL
jgi:hypothetical protein